MLKKQDWLKEAVSYIDSLNSEEFEAFLKNCSSPHKPGTIDGDLMWQELLRNQKDKPFAAFVV